MTTVIARCVASTPVRTASATWGCISALIAPDADGDARAELDRVRGVAASAIAAEATSGDAIVVHGGGPRVRIYCAFNDDAIGGDDVNEDPLPRSPTEGDWRISIPFREEDLGWARAELARVSSRVDARKVGEDIVEERGEQATRNASAHGVVNTSEFFKS